ncbi:MAG: UxaA family hydrolase [Pseudomonadota bacterium]
MNAIPFDQLARLPADGDNVAIAVRNIEPGTVVQAGNRQFEISHYILEGHRFAAERLEADTYLLSWGLPFGRALRGIEPGEYVCNAKILTALSERHVAFDIPETANFEDHLQRYEIDPATFVAGEPTETLAEPGTFLGFRRHASRGVGTRNFVVVMGTTSRSGPFAQALADSFHDIKKRFPNVDDVCAIVHTEGGGTERPNNLDFVLRVLAGFMVHSNVGAVLALDYGTEAFTNDDVHAYLEEHDYPLDKVPHAFMRIGGNLNEELERAAALIEGWLPLVNETARTPQPLSALKIALQCGGSDAFSGISGNALAGWIAKETIRNGGAAVLAETDELIGAEPYVLNNVRDLDTARVFLEKIEVFKERAERHGATAEGNPSGGNNFRGLYNIALKSIGAARKRDPDVRLDYVIDYGALMREPGYYFMDSPGNDLESIAGQVASGSNLILFITGNGSVTNFPFVPTLKFVTTTGRFNMLAKEMDVNAGRYNDGMSMDALGEETFQLAVDVISGEQSKGELAGHAQVSIWRNWTQTESGQVEKVKARARPDGTPLEVAPGTPSQLTFAGLPSDRGVSIEQIGVVMPTSLCSGQVARLVAEHLNQRVQPDDGVTRYVSLVHTEGCGSVNAEDLFLRTLLGHVRHPNTRRALLLEHGCEKTHNDAVRNYLTDVGVDIDTFGWASVQLDGGLGSVTEKCTQWFETDLRGVGMPEVETHGANALRIALTSTGAVCEQAATVLGELVRGLASAGATVVVAENASFSGLAGFAGAALGPDEAWHATVEYAGWPETGGLHVMQTPTSDPLETITGLGATGAHLIVHYAGDAPAPNHPMVPVVQISGETVVTRRYDSDLDHPWQADAQVRQTVEALEGLIARIASREARPKLFGRGPAGFQLTRGLLGISL